MTAVSQTVAHGSLISSPTGVDPATNDPFFASIAPAKRKRLPNKFRGMRLLSSQSQLRALPETAP